MTYRVVTTIHAAGWEAYGRRMAQSVLERWAPEALPLMVYAEDFDPEPMAGLEVRRLPAWLDAFKARWGCDHRANGQTGEGYRYIFDAVKFAHKVAALTDAAAQLDDGVLIWLDADTFTHAPVDAAWLDGLGLGDGYIAWLDRLRSHPECGFVMFRCDHPYHQTFMARFRELYETGEVFGLRETHDSFVLQHLALAKHANGKIPPPVSLSGWAVRTTHPFANGPLGSRLDHMKGPRKQEGRSRPRDLVRPRDEAYWA
jgi:hypothetical protein